MTSPGAARPAVAAPAPAAEGGLQALDMLGTLVALVATDGTLRWVNTAFEATVGVARRALLRGNLCEWFDAPARLRESLAAVASNGVATARFEAAIRRVSVAGTPNWLPVHVIVTQPVAGGGDRVLVEAIEVEQQTRQDREERLHEQARAHKALLRNLAHEVKNPLGGIRGAAQLLAMDLGDDPALRAYTDIVVHEVDRLHALVDRLLAPHRHPHVVGDVNLHEVCERVRTLLVAEHPGLVVQRDYDTSLPEFRGDREQLMQAVLNIAQNGAQAMLDARARDASAAHPDGAPRTDAAPPTLVFRTRAVRQVTLGKARHRLALELQIEDHGPGIPEPLRERIFHPLVSGREGGSGLGLALAQTFVEQHRGSIECESVPGRTVFRIVLPLP